MKNKKGEKNNKVNKDNSITILNSFDEEVFDSKVLVDKLEKQEEVLLWIELSEYLKNINDDRICYNEENVTKILEKFEKEQNYNWIPDRELAKKLKE